MGSPTEALADYAAAVTLGAILPAARTPIEHIVSGYLFDADEGVRHAAVIALGGREAVLSSRQTVGLLVDAFNAGFVEGLKLKADQKQPTASDATTTEPTTGAVAVSSTTSYVAVAPVTRSRARVATIMQVETGRSYHALAVRARPHTPDRNCRREAGGA